MKVFFEIHFWISNQKINTKFLMFDFSFQIKKNELLNFEFRFSILFLKWVTPKFVLNPCMESIEK